jgi:hypothetical protein
MYDAHRAPLQKKVLISLPRQNHSRGPRANAARDQGESYQGPDPRMGALPAT